MGRTLVLAYCDIRHPSNCEAFLRVQAIASDDPAHLPPLPGQWVLQEDVTLVYIIFTWNIYLRYQSLYLFYWRWQFSRSHEASRRLNIY